MISARQRRIIRTRYLGRCGYCGVAEADIGALLTIDHHQPLSLGGGDDLDNLVYCCFACNLFKAGFWAASVEVQRILHPLRDDIAVHFHERPDGVLEAYTQTGQFHIERLQLNRTPLVRYRQERRARTEEHQLRSELRQQLDAIQKQLQRLEDRLERFETER